MIWFAMRAAFWLAVVYAFLPPDGETAQAAREAASDVAESASRQIVRLCDAERALCDAAAQAPVVVLDYSERLMSEAADALQADAERQGRR